MSRGDFERWLDTPAPDPSAIANPAEMFTGWYWDGKAADWHQAEIGDTPREYFADCFAQEGDGLTYILTYRDGALEAYLMHFGFCESNVYTALLMLTAAGKLTSDSAGSTVLFWAETSCALRESDWNGWLATLEVSPSGARFVSNTDLSHTISSLKPAEDKFFDLVTRLAGAYDSTAKVGESGHVDIIRDPRYADPAIFA
ncbi:hypothetical protein ACFVUS_07015 [Nocardia sp. NPDC058058]|uniref:hypothetical protein n=1 Tax=Nocardia sp. NPDC058058 TaxID=3346317 RepID=UPI0036D90299